MQEFEAWRVKDLEARNKREKVGLGPARDCSQVLAVLIRGDPKWSSNMADSGKWTIEIGDVPILKPEFIGDFPASHV